MSRVSARVVLAFVGALGLSAGAIARPDEECFHIHAAQPEEAKKYLAFDPVTGKDLWTYPPSAVADFIHMKVVLDIPDMNVPRAGAEQTLTLSAIGTPLASLTLDARLLEISEVKCEGHTAKFTADGKTLTITFDPPLAVGTKTDIVTRYTINDPPAGLFWVPESPDWPGRAAQLHTQGQAETNSYWFPCHDFPNDRLTTELIVTVPAGYLVSSNGREVEPVKRAGNRDTFYWLQDKPHVAYLVTLVVGKFDVVDVAPPGSRISMPVYVGPGRGKDVKATYGNTARMVELFERRTGQPYPWDRYAQLTVWNFASGGMENTGATSMYDMAILSEAALIDMDLEGLISHELAHQWFGDLITCKSWEHTWLNEGFATYFTNLWLEERDGKNGYQAGVRGNFDAVAGSDKAGAPYVKAMVTKAYTDAWQQFGGAANPYSKGAAILHMLRIRLGDEVFFRALGVYMQKYRMDLVETNDFRRVMEDESGESLDRFFRQWCYRPGAPEVDIDIGWDAPASEIVVVAKQLQNIDAYNPAFDLSIPVWAMESGGTVRRLGTIEMEERTSETRFKVNGEPRFVEIDPNLTTLAKFTINQPSERWAEQAQKGSTWAARCQAIRFLSEDADEQETALLVGIAKSESEDKNLRVEATKAIGKNRNPAAMLEIAATPNLPSDVAVEVIAQANSLAKDERVDSTSRARLKELLVGCAKGNRSERVRAEAVKGLGELKAVDKMAIIADAAKADSQNDRVRQAAIAALANLDAPDGLPIVLRYAQAGTYNRTRPEAIDAAVKLSKYGPDVVYSTLASMLEDRESRARQAAGAGLSRLGDKRALEDLTKLKTSRLYAGNPATVEGWIAEAKKKLGVEEPTPVASTHATGLLWVPIAEPARWAQSESDKELLRGNPEAFFARFGLITGTHEGTTYLLCSDKEDARMLGGEGWSVSDVKVLGVEDAMRSIAFELNDAGAEKFGPMTERNIGRPLAMIVDGKVYSAPNLRSRIEGSGQITGTFSNEDAEKLAAAIREPGKLTLRVAGFVTEVADPQVLVRELKEKGPGAGGNGK